MTRSQAVDALAALNKSKPRKMRRNECAIKIYAQTKKKTTSSKPTPKQSTHVAKKKGKSIARTFKYDAAEQHWTKILARNFMCEGTLKSKPGPLSEILKRLEEVG